MPKQYAKNLAIIMLFTFSVSLFFAACKEDPAKKLTLGFGECSPVILVPVGFPMTISISNIDYSEVGEIASFQEQISITDARPISVQVQIDWASFTGICNSLKYRAVVGRTSLDSPEYDQYKKTTLVDRIGLSLDDVLLDFPPPSDPTLHRYRMEGLIIYDSEGKLKNTWVPNDIETRYYNEGRLLYQQLFRLNGVDYVAEYSDYAYSEYSLGSGHTSKRISGFKVSIHPADLT